MHSEKPTSAVENTHRDASPLFEYFIFAVGALFLVGGLALMTLGYGAVL